MSPEPNDRNPSQGQPGRRPWAHDHNRHRLQDETADVTGAAHRNNRRESTQPERESSPGQVCGCNQDNVLSRLAASPVMPYRRNRIT